MTRIKLLLGAVLAGVVLTIGTAVVSGPETASANTFAPAPTTTGGTARPVR